MSGGRGRIAGSLGPQDPRNRRGQSLRANEDVQVGSGLEVDREGRIRVRKCDPVDDLPDAYTTADLADRVAKIIDSLKRGEIMEG